MTTTHAYVGQLLLKLENAQNGKIFKRIKTWSLAFLIFLNLGILSIVALGALEYYKSTAMKASGPATIAVKR